jgi:hypothetical protein
VAKQQKKIYRESQLLCISLKLASIVIQKDLMSITRLKDFGVSGHIGLA